jgi:hypothetical protein
MATLDDNDYIELSLYHFQLAQYLTFFPIEQLLVIASEDLRDMRHKTLERVFRFLGVEDAFDSSAFDVLANRSDEKWRYKPLGKVFRALKLHQRLMYSLPTVARRVYARATVAVVPKPPISQTLRRRLADFIAPDTAQLRLLVGQEFRAWSL